MLIESCSTNIVAYSVIIAKLIVDPDLAEQRTELFPRFDVRCSAE